MNELHESLKQRLDELSTDLLNKYHQKAFDDFNDRSPESNPRKDKRLRGLKLVNKALSKKKYSRMHDVDTSGGVRKSMVEEYSTWRDWNDDYVKLLKKRNKIQRDHEKVTRFTGLEDAGKAAKLKAKLEQTKNDIANHQKKSRPDGYTLSNTIKR